MEELLSSQCMFYSMTETFSNFTQMRNHMDEEVDVPSLDRALQTTILRYPYFKVKLVRKGEELFLAENRKPLLIYPDVESPTMAPEKNNDYLFRISAAGDIINISFCHAISDGGGIMPFIKTLLHYYFVCKLGEESGASDLRLSGDPVPPLEVRDYLLDFKPDPDVLVLPQKDSEVFSLPVQVDPSGARHVFLFTLDSRAFMKYSHEIDGSPNALMALFMARAVRKVHPQEDHIVAGVAANYRKASGNLYGYQCNVGLLKLRYLPKMDSMDISTCATCFRGGIILQSDDSVVKRSLAGAQQLCRYIKSLKTLEEKCEVSWNVVLKGSSGDTFTVSYVGKQDFGKISSHIRFMEAVVDGIGSHMAVEIMCIGGNFFITVTQDFADPVYVKEMVKEMEAEGIHCEGFREETVPYEDGPVPLKIAEDV